VHVCVFCIDSEVKNVYFDNSSFFLSQGLVYSSGWLHTHDCGLVWPGTHNPSASASPVLGFHVCADMCG
jgi:hypothetical protein